MNEQVEEHENLANVIPEAQITDGHGVEETTTEITDTTIAPTASKPKAKKLTIAIIAAAAVAIIAVALVLFIPSKFERVKNECVHIAGSITGSGDYFIIDTYPDEYEYMNPSVVALLKNDAQENALKAIRYANEELGFNGSVYSQMMKTTALMGRQTAENDKYKVSWTYHPDDGLEVTYEKK